MLTVEYAACRYIYLYTYLSICRYVGIYSTVSNVYRVNSFIVPEMQCVVYATCTEYKLVESPCCNQSLFTAYRHA